MNNKFKYISESYLFSDKDISIDLHKFENGKSNKLIILGLSGAGKSTMAIFLRGYYNCKSFHIDNLWHDLNIIPKDEIRVDGEVNDKQIDKFYKTLKNIMLNKKRLIIEGVNIVGDEEIENIALKLPVIILGTSITLSAFRGLDRMFFKIYKHGKIIDHLKNYKDNIISNFIHLRKDIELFKNKRISQTNAIIKDFDYEKYNY